MGCQWRAEKNEMSFGTDDLQGVLVADCDDKQSANNRHRIRDLVHKGTGVRVSPEGGMMERAGSFTVFRAYARRSWLTEMRAMPPEVVRKENGATLTWSPTFQHQARLTATFSVEEPDSIDLDITVEGYTFYPDYELLISNYVAPTLSGGLFVKEHDLAHDAEREKIMVTDSPAYHGMYPFFPRDERAAHVLTDGRGQKGRWYWRVACGRLYALPLGFATDGQVDVVLMGRPEDVSAVGVTYSAEGDQYDGVARHHALYLSLFGKDLHPGDGWRTQVRLVVGAFGNQDDALASAFERFFDEKSAIGRTFEVTPE